jgi:CRP/FNR family transcriptional regulator, cyclic AMP receptor protein
MILSVWRDVLTLTEGLPERSLAAGEVLFSEGDPSLLVMVLVSGQLEVDQRGVVVIRHERPGSFVGEVSALLHQPHSSTVTALVPTIVREIGHPEEFFEAHPHLSLEMAGQLAGRLHRLTAYIADVRRQFGDHDSHLGMFGDLLDRIAAHRPIDIEPGSDRSPDY